MIHMKCQDLFSLKNKKKNKKKLSSAAVVIGALRVNNILTDEYFSCNVGFDNMILILNSLIPDFLKWTLPSLNLDMSTDANRVLV